MLNRIYGTLYETNTAVCIFNLSPDWIISIFSEFQANPCSLEYSQFVERVYSISYLLLVFLIAAFSLVLLFPVVSTFYLWLQHFLFAFALLNVSLIPFSVIAALLVCTVCLLHLFFCIDGLWSSHPSCVCSSF